jgi:AraC-like DNA-binding protein
VTGHGRVRLRQMRSVREGPWRPRLDTCRPATAERSEESGCVERAAHLLRETDEVASRIAAEASFRDQSHM